MQYKLNLVTTIKKNFAITVLDIHSLIRLGTFLPNLYYVLIIQYKYGLTQLRSIITNYKTTKNA